MSRAAGLCIILFLFYYAWVLCVHLIVWDRRGGKRQRGKGRDKGRELNGITKKDAERESIEFMALY